MNPPVGKFNTRSGLRLFASFATPAFAAGTQSARTIVRTRTGRDEQATAIRDGRIARGIQLVALIACVSLAGCSLLGGKKTMPTQYAPAVRAQADAAWPNVNWQLALARVQVAHPYDSLRIAVRPSPQELQIYKGATWAQKPGDMIEASLLRVLEDSGKVHAVARSDSGIKADYRLLLDVRRFESDYAGQTLPRATIEINAKLVHALDADVVASQTFVQAEPAAGTDVAQVVEAFDRALARVDHDIAGWALETGVMHGRGAKH